MLNLLKVSKREGFQNGTVRSLKSDTLDRYSYGRKIENAFTRAMYSSLEKVNQAVIEVLKQEKDIIQQTTIPLRNINDSSYILVLVDDNSCLVSANSETRLNSCLCQSLLGKRPSHLSHKVNCLQLFLACVWQLTISRCSRRIFKRGNAFKNAFSIISN